ncbi:MAG: hypothetical protein F6K42_13015 [Leptolyngbya sp. SIO1D8]|nr:hypothetical protein [Leptolyngbya sp. SIO1D8]
MEALAILFVAFLFFWLLSPYPAKKPPKPADKIVDGLKAAAQVMGSEWGNAPPSEPKKKSGPWPVVFTAILVGFLMTYLL